VSECSLAHNTLLIALDKIGNLAQVQQGIELNEVKAGCHANHKSSH